MKYIKALLIAWLVSLVALSACAPTSPETAPPAQPVEKMGVTTLRFMGPDPGPQFELNEKLLAEFEAQTGIQVEQIAGPESATDRLNEYLITLGSESDEVDVYHKIKSIVYRFDVLERWAASRTRWMCTRST